MERGVAVHTVPDPERRGWWVNKVKGEVVTRHRKKEIAIATGRGIAQEMRLEHNIHRRDGVITEKNSYGNDPNPPKDER